MVEFINSRPTEEREQKEKRWERLSYGTGRSAGGSDRRLLGNSLRGDEKARTGADVSGEGLPIVFERIEECGWARVRDFECGTGWGTPWAIGRSILLDRTNRRTLFGVIHRPPETGRTAT